MEISVTSDAKLLDQLMNGLSKEKKIDIRYSDNKQRATERLTQYVYNRTLERINENVCKMSVKYRNDNYLSNNPYNVFPQIEVNVVL